MKKSILIYVTFCLTVLLTSCGEELDDKYEYLAIKSEISVSESSISTKGAGSTYRIQINCNSYWTATTNANWLSLATSRGKGNGTLNLDVEANPSTTSERKGEVSITDGIKILKVTVTQAPVDAVLNVNKSSLDFTYQGGSSSITVDANVDWTATSDANWCTLSKTSSGFTVTAQTNNSYLSRTAKISVKNSSVSNSPVIAVSQGAPKEPTVGSLTISDITKTTANCSFTFNSSDLSVIKCGVSYGLAENSLTNDIYASYSSYSGTASLNLSGLTQNTTYYVQPYVVTSAGTTYGNVAQFTTLDIISPNENDNPTPSY